VFGFLRGGNEKNFENHWSRLIFAKVAMTNFVGNGMLVKKR